MKMEEWKECKLSEIMDLIGGGTPKTSNPDYWDGDIPWISVKDFNGERRYVGDTEKKITKLGLENSSTKILSKGDIIISARGTVGELAIIPSDMAFNQSCYGLRAKDFVDSCFLYYLLKQSVNILKHNTHGSVFDTITRETFENISVRLPPLPTQQKSAAILSSLDDKIELNNKINTNLEQQAQSLFKNWFVDKYEKEGTIGDYCAVKSGFAFKSAWWQEEGTKVIRIGDIEQGCLNLETCAHIANDKIEIAKDFIVQGGDLVIAMTGATIGKFSMIPKTQEPILVNQRVGKFFLSDNPIEKVPFIYCTLKQEEVITEFINRGQGSAQPNISTGDILSIPCWIPSKNEIDNFNKTIQPMFETIISNQEENRKLSALRDSLLPKLMNGEIEV